MNPTIQQLLQLFAPIDKLHQSGNLDEAERQLDRLYANMPELTSRISSGMDIMFNGFRVAAATYNSLGRSNLQLAQNGNRARLTNAANCFQMAQEMAQLPMDVEYGILTIALWGAGHVAYLQGNRDASRNYLKECISVDLGRTPNEAATKAQQDAQQLLQKL